MNKAIPKQICLLNYFSTVTLFLTLPYSSINMSYLPQHSSLCSCFLSEILFLCFSATAHIPHPSVWLRYHLLYKKPFTIGSQLLLFFLTSLKKKTCTMSGKAWLYTVFYYSLFWRFILSHKFRWIVNSLKVGMVLYMLLQDVQRI